jgi:hypothetical protein
VATLLTRDQQTIDRATEVRKTRGNLWLVLVAVILGATLIDNLSTRPLTVNVDSAMYLECGQLLLEGKIPYVDFIELNPPLIMYLSAIPCAVARALNVSVFACFIVMVWGCAVASTAACYHVLRKSSLKQNWTMLGPLLVAIALGTFVTRCDYGQREHLFVLSYLPFFLMRWCRQEGEGHFPRWYALTLGIIAGIGMCLKPIFFLPALAVEAFWLFRNRQPSELKRPEVVGAALATFAYGAHFLFCPPAMQAAFFGFIVPIVTRGYPAYDCTLYDALSVTLHPFYGGYFYGVSWFLPAFLFAMCAASFFLRSRSTLLMPLAIWSFAGYAILVAQQKCFSYHTIPMVAGSFMLAAILFSLVSKLGSFNRRFTQPAVDGVLLLVVLLLFGVRNSCAIYTRNDLIKEFKGKIQAGDQVMFLAGLPWPAYPFLNQVSAQSGSRYIWQFLPPLIDHCKKNAEPRERARLEGLESRILSDMAEDIRVRRPKYVIMSTDDLNRADNHFLLYEYLEKRNFIAGAMKDYRFVTCFKQYRIYEHE